MPITIPHPLTVQEIRVLQEFRRMSADTLTGETIGKIKHPAGGGEAAKALVDKGYLAFDGSGDTYALTDKSKQFLAIDYRPIEPPAAKSSE